MTLLDESVYTGFNIWCPLVDLHPDNGPLYVLPGSHRIVPTLRGSTIPAIYEETHEEILSLMTPVYIKAGTAIIFDQSIIHASPPNHSNQLRVVTNTFFTHRDATIRTCYYDRQINKIEVFEHEDNFMTNYENFGYNIHSRPSIGRSLGYVDYEFPKLTREELVRRYGDIPLKPVIKKKGFLRRIFDI